MGYVGAKIV